MTTPSGYFPAYDGRANATDHLVQPWFVPGWEAQNIAADTVVAGNNNIFGPGFPTNLAFVEVTGNYFDTNGSGLAGYITVMMSDGITVLDGSNTYRLPRRYTGTMSMVTPFGYNNWGSQRLYLRLGRLDIILFATDQTASGSTVTTDSGNSLFYFVTEHWLNGRTYHIQVPSTAAGTVVDINSLIVPGTINEYKYDPVFPDGNMWTPETDLYNTLDTYTGV